MSEENEKRVLEWVYIKDYGFNREDFCCEEMYQHLIGPDGDGCEIHIEYFPNTREFSIPYKEGTGGGVQLIHYCPWCGIKLPKELRDEFFDILENEYGIETDIGEYKVDPRIPLEFKSDKWWKKREL